MKNVLKLIVLFFMVLSIKSCDNAEGLNDGKFGAIPETGWVEFSSTTGSAIIVLQATELVIPLSIKVPVFPNGLNITYAIEPVQGNVAPFVSTDGSLFVSPDNVTGTASILLEFNDLSQIQEQLIFDVVLTSVDAPGVTIGVDENSVTRFRVSTPCPSVYSSSYNVDVAALGSTAPSHTVALVPVAGTTNQFTIASTWGPNFVGWATGDPAFNGQYVYSGNITVNPNLTVTVTGNAGYATGGSGTYDPCLDQFQITLNQELFSGTSFTVSIIMNGL